MLSRTEAHEALRWLQRERGICSDPDCDQPIEGWCATCDATGPFKAPKLCARHLGSHCIVREHQPHCSYAPVTGGAA